MSITRAEILRRSTLYMGQIPYSQSKLWTDGYRQDCSGYVSRCWAAPTSGEGTWGGYSTQTFVTRGVMYQIEWADLQPGDAIGRCGPGTIGTGHIMLWLAWAGATKGPGGKALIRDHGSGNGPKERTVTIPSDYRAYRFTGVEGAITPALGYRELQQGDVGTDVAQLQHLLNQAGASPKLVEDGEFGPVTHGAVVALQTKAGIEVDGIVGPQTLAALNAGPTPTPAPTPDPQVDVAALAQAVAAALTTALASALRAATPTADQIAQAVKQALREGTSQ